MDTSHSCKTFNIRPHVFELFCRQTDRQTYRKTKAKIKPSFWRSNWHTLFHNISLLWSVIHNIGQSESIGSLSIRSEAYCMNARTQIKSNHLLISGSHEARLVTVPKQHSYTNSKPQDMQIWNKTNDYIRKYAWKLVKACIIKYFMGICSKYKQLLKDPKHTNINRLCRSQRSTQF